MLQTRRLALEFQDYFSKQEKKKAVEVVVWKLPCTDMIKINIDGSFFKAAGHGGWGVVARDADGDVCFSAAGKLNHAQNALQTEAEACIKALGFAREYGMQRVQIEIDAQMLVKAISSADLDLSPNDVMLREIKVQVFLHFNSFSMSYCPRTCNKVAHALASFGAKVVVESQVVWPGRVPTSARDLVANDLVAHVA
uniref:RNase H type-1 domain-containing protein n=1 Tax=Hordeum vulgare subsp. vulgare TaxID=112509 RepID=A0A8I6WVG6_HORVV